MGEKMVRIRFGAVAARTEAGKNGASRAAPPAAAMAASKRRREYDVDAMFILLGKSGRSRS